MPLSNPILPVATDTPRGLPMLAIASGVALVHVGLAAALWHIRPVVVAPVVSPPLIVTLLTSAAPVAEPKQPVPPAPTPPKATPKVAPKAPPKAPPKVAPKPPKSVAPRPPAPTSQPVVHAPKTVAVLADTPQAQAVSEPSPPVRAPAPAPAPAPTPAPTPAPAPAPPPGPPPTLNIDGVRYLRRPEVVYPAASKDLDEEGEVVVRILVGEDGRVRRASIERSSGYDRLDREALRALRAVQLKPYTVNGRPQAFETLAPLAFNLN